MTTPDRLGGLLGYKVILTLIIELARGRDIDNPDEDGRTALM